MKEKVLSFHVEGASGERLDKYLTQHVDEVSRSYLQTLIDDGYVEVDGRPAKKRGQFVEGGQRIVLRIPPPPASALVPEDIALDILYENSDVLIVNKPAGMVVHPAPGHKSGTLVNAILGRGHEVEGIEGQERAGIVHRLDKETSGLIVIAKNDRAQGWLQRQFQLRRVDKVYLALVDGKPPTSSGRVEAPVGRDPRDHKRMAVAGRGRGRDAVSEYRTLERFQNHTLLEVRPLTGRTHQIRLHCAFLGCPIVGDKVYGKKQATIALDRQFLHAHRLRLALPDASKAHVFEVPLPPELENVLSRLRSGAQ